MLGWLGIIVMLVIAILSFYITIKENEPGCVFVGLIFIIAFATIMGINQAFAAFFGGTSLLILVGVVLDTLQQIESHLLMRHYDGLLKSGRIKGRTGGAAAY